MASGNRSIELLKQQNRWIGRGRGGVVIRSGERALLDPHPRHGAPAEILRSSFHGAGGSATAQFSFELCWKNTQARQ